MKLRELYSLDVFSWFLNFEDELREGIEFTKEWNDSAHNRVDKCELVYNIIKVNDEGTIVSVTPDSCKAAEKIKNEDMLTKEVSEGYWIFYHDCFDTMRFFWYPTLKKAKRAFNKIKLCSIIHPNALLFDKYLFQCTDTNIRLIRYMTLSKTSKFLLPKYKRYFENPILRRLEKWAWESGLKKMRAADEEENR